jgi:hypothetical protein
MVSRFFGGWFGFLRELCTFIATPAQGKDTRAPVSLGGRDVNLAQSWRESSFSQSPP